MGRILLFLTVVFSSFTMGYAQDITVLRLEDFDLNGKVKSCTVINSYGKEVFEFDENGRLRSTKTQYSDTDTHWVNYAYEGNYLKEKRSEHYSNGTLNKEQSIVNIYQIDTLKSSIKITEKVVSYNKEFLEQIVYTLNLKGETLSIQKLHADAVDEIKVSHTTTASGEIIEYVLNGSLQKWIRKRMVPGEGKTKVKEVLTREYFNEEPYLAIEERYDASGALLSKEQFLYDDTVNKYITEERHDYVYTEKDILKGEKITSRNTVTEKQYVFQYDNSSTANWIRKIILPDNSYTSRVIEYYTEEVKETKKGR